MNRKVAALICGALAAFSIANASTTEAAGPEKNSDEAPIVRVPRASAGGLTLLPGVAPKGPEHLGLFKGATQQAASCPDNMIEVEGDYCPHVEQKCLKWVDENPKLRCLEFAPTSNRCMMKTQRRHFCIDKFEWPNRRGEKPILMKSWYEAREMCGSMGKRLCNDSEWTLACEGAEHLPYPYGYKRNNEACNIDKPWYEPDPYKVYNPITSDTEVARLDQREASGSRSSCVSPYGVHDMAGNVDEWVVNETMGGRPFKSGLKGGYWGPVRTRCRPMTTAHEESFKYYQIGFRCCGDPGRVPGNSMADVAGVRRTWGAR